MTGKQKTENPRQRNREACTGGKLQDGGRIEDKHEIRSSKYEANSNDRNTKFKRDAGFLMVDSRISKH